MILIEFKAPRKELNACFCIYLIHFHEVLCVDNIPPHPFVCIAHNLAILSPVIATDTVSAILRKFFSNINPGIDTLSNMVMSYRLIFPVEEERNRISLNRVCTIHIKGYFSLIVPSNGSRNSNVLVAKYFHVLLVSILIVHVNIF
jgi:hypothetical protein